MSAGQPPEMTSGSPTRRLLKRPSEKAPIEVLHGEMNVQFIMVFNEALDALRGDGTGLLVYCAIRRHVYRKPGNSFAIKREQIAKEAEELQRHRAELELINGILGPIGFGEQPNPSELSSFVEWSAFGDSRMKLLTLEVALSDPRIALRVARP